jgi:integrase
LEADKKPIFNGGGEAESRASPTSGEFILHFSQSELNNFVAGRRIGLAKKSVDWIDRASNLLWESTKGEVSSRTLRALRERVLAKYKSADSHSKVLNFAVSFLKFLAKTRMEPRYASFEAYLEMPKAVKERKSITSRIVTKDDIENVLRHIKQAKKNGTLDAQRSAQYSAFVIFGAFTGQHSMAMMANLTVGQFREALRSEKPVLRVESSQDKIRMERYVPWHPQVVSAIEAMLGDRKNEDRAFGYNSFQMWMKRQEIPMSHFEGHFVPSDLQKFAEQHGDAIEWEQSNRKYVLTHGVGGVDWSHYKRPLPESVYDIYMKYWGDVSLKT